MGGVSCLGPWMGRGSRCKPRLREYAYEDNKTLPKLNKHSTFHVAPFVYIGG